MSLTQPSRTIVVEPLELPAVAPSPAAPAPAPPAPAAPAVQEPAVAR